MKYLLLAVTVAGILLFSTVQRMTAQADVIYPGKIPIGDVTPGPQFNTQWGATYVEVTQTLEAGAYLLGFDVTGLTEDGQIYSDFGIQRMVTGQSCNGILGIGFTLESVSAVGYPDTDLETFGNVDPGDRVAIYTGLPAGGATYIGDNYDLGVQVADVLSFGLQALIRVTMDPPYTQVAYVVNYRDMHYIVDSATGDCEVYPLATTLPLPFPSTCSIVYTDTITSGTYTQTITTTHTVDSNLLTNYSFESGSGAVPAGWQSVVGGAVSIVPPFYDKDPANARSGYRSVYNGSDFDLYQTLSLRAAGDYRAGFYANGPSADLYLNGSFIASSSSSGGYQLVDGIDSTGGGGGWIYIDFDSGSSTYVDDIFLIPVDGSGDLLCDAAYYPDPGDLEGDCVRYPESAGCVTVPTGGAGSACYFCQVPSGGYLYVSYWIAWLGCVMRNLFSCSLRVWLLVIGNWINGNLQIGLAFLSWVPITVQGGADWVMGEVVPAIVGAMTGNNGVGSSIWDAIISLIGLLSTLISSLSNVMLGIVGLMTSLIDALRSGLAADPIVFQFGSGDITAPIAGDLAVAGRTDSKILYMVLMGIGSIDSILFSHTSVQTILSVVLGAVGVFVAIWTLRYWRNFVTL